MLMPALQHFQIIITKVPNNLIIKTTAHILNVVVEDTMGHKIHLAAIPLIADILLRLIFRMLRRLLIIWTLVSFITFYPFCNLGFINPLTKSH